LLSISVPALFSYTKCKRIQEIVKISFFAGKGDEKACLKHYETIMKREDKSLYAVVENGSNPC
jgi:hypothetical protein